MWKFALAIMLAVGGFSITSASANDPPKHEPEKGKGKPDEKPKEEAPRPTNKTLPISIGEYYDVPDITVNMKTYDTKQSFLKISISMQMEKESDRAAVDIIIPQIVDGLQSYMRELTPASLNGSSGMYRLRQEILLRASKIASPLVIKDILFKEVIIH